MAAGTGTQGRLGLMFFDDLEVQNPETLEITVP